MLCEFGDYGCGPSSLVIWAWQFWQVSGFIINIIDVYDKTNTTMGDPAWQFSVFFKIGVKVFVVQCILFRGLELFPCVSIVYLDMVYFYRCFVLP